MTTVSKVKTTPEPAGINARKPSSSSVASIGSVTQSKLRLLSNNRLLALLLNKKKMENRTLRDSNSKLSVSLSQYKHAYRILRGRLEATNTTVRNLQNAAPTITKDILSLFDRFEKMGTVLASVNVEDIENQSFINNISLADNSLKPKPLRSRRAINKVRPMKYGLVLGNPVVSLHRLGPQLTSISQQSESDFTDTENDTAEDGSPDVGNTSGPQSPNSPVPSNTSSVHGSPIRPHHRVAELTLSVPVLQSMGTAIMTPKKRMRPAGNTTPSQNLLKQQELQLKTPCRVLIENLEHNQTASPNEGDFSSSKSTPDALGRKKKRVKRAAKHREIQSDGETASVKKMSDEELKKMLTPLQVEIKLPRIGLTDYRTDNTQPRRTVKRRARKSLPTCTILNVEFSDSDKDSDQEFPNRRQKLSMEKISSEVENQRPLTSVTFRNRLRKNQVSDSRTLKCSKMKSSSLLKVKILSCKGPRSNDKVADSEENERSEEEKLLKKKVLPLKRKLNDTVDEKKTEKLETNSKLLEPKKAETDKEDENTAEGVDSVKEKQSSPTPIQIESQQVDDESEMAINLTEESAKQSDMSSSDLIKDKPLKKLGKMRGPKSKRVPSPPKSTVNASLPTEDEPPPKEQAPLVLEPVKPKKMKPMPLSKKRLLGLVIDDDLIIDEETICSVKTEMGSPAAPSPSRNGPRSQCFMDSFLKRLSMEDPLEGTSRQHVYKKPLPSQTASEKKSLRQLEKKSYQESPVSDAIATDDDTTWYPNKNKAK